MKPLKIFLRFIASGGLVVLFSLLVINGCQKEEVVPVEADIVVSPENISLNDIDTAYIYLSTKPEKQVSWQIAGLPDWLAANPSSGEINGNIIEVQLISKVDGLQQGHHYNQLEFISDKAGKGTCTVELFVDARPVASLSPAALDFQAGTDSLYITVKNTGTGYLEWEITPSAGWLQAMPSSGTCSGGYEDEILVTVDRNDMPVGDYNASLQLVSNSEIPVGDVTVQMTVPEMYTMSANLDTVYFGYFFEVREIYLSNTGNMSFTWNLEIAEDFISGTNTSGTLNPGDSVLVTVTADRQNLAEGSFLADLLFTNNKGITLGVPVVVNKYIETKWMLDYKIIDAEYDRVHDVIIAVTDYPYLLLKLDPVAQTMTSVTLELAPMCVSVNPAGTQAVVGHDAKVTYINLETMATNNVFNTSVIAFDIVISPNNYGYVFPATDQWTDILCINLFNGVSDWSTGYSIYAGTRAKLHPSGNYIYGADNGLSPSDFEKYDIREGIADFMYDSPYHGDYSFGGDIWISDDGNRLFARSRNVFIATENEATDMTYNGNLAGSSYLQTLDHSSATNRIFAIGFEGDYWETYPSDVVSMYEDEYLNYTGSVTLPGFLVPNESGDGDYFRSEGHFGFFNSTGDRFHVLVRAPEGSGMLTDWAVVTVE